MARCKFVKIQKIRVVRGSASQSFKFCYGEALAKLKQHKNLKNEFLNSLKMKISANMVFSKENYSS